MVGAIFIPALFTKFVFNLIEKKNNSIILLNWLCVICFLPFSFSNIFISGLEQRMMFSYWPIPGLLFHFVLFYFIANTIYAHVLLWSAIKMMSGNQKMQVIWVFAGTLIGFIGGSTNYFLWYGIPVTPSLNILVSLYIITVAYAIVKLRFFDINVIIKKTFVFAGLLAFVFGVFSAATFIVRDILGRYLGVNNFWINAISIFLIVLGYDPIRRFLVNLTDTYLFQKKYDYQKLLKDASRGISKIKSLQHLLSLVVHFITMRMRVTNAAVLSKQDEDNRFKLVYQRGFKKNFMEYFIDHDSELIRYLSFEHEAIDIEMVNDGIEAGNKKVIKGQESREYDFEAIKRTMEEIETSCCIPSFLGKELRNVLILGEKKSGDYYVEADLNVLYTLAQESAIAIENARLYDEARNKAKELGDINGQLEYAKNLLMKALNDTEVANKQLQDTQAQLIHEQKMATLGRLAASVGHEVNNPLTILSMNVSRVLLKLRKNPDLKVNEIMDTFDKMEQNIGRIKAVVNTLTGLLKKSEKGKFEPLSLKLILEETLPLVQFQTYLDNLTGTEVDFEVPGNLPLVRGDLERLQEVFLNLFINAYHAMEGKQYRRIRVTAEVDPTDKDMVCIRFQDNGKGMDDETRKKIFNYRFTTKAPGKGSGLGLYMCKYIVELHGGSMHVNSKLDEGTTFVIGLPSSDKKLVLPEGDMSQPPPHAGEDQASA
jgi:signal transduction histidine kinase